jgi:hypothetical protein
MKRKGVDTLFPLNNVDPNHRRLAGELYGRDNRVELGQIEIAIELFARLPILDQQQGLAFVEIRIETGIQATGCNPRWSKHRSERPQQGRSPFIGCHDLHGENDQDPCLSVVVDKWKRIHPPVARSGPTCRARRPREKHSMDQ